MPDMPGMPDMRAPATPATRAQPAAMPDMAMMGGQLAAYPMTRDSSGTSWQPQSTPMQGFGWSSGAWTGMAEGFASLIYDHQGGPRGGDKTFSENMGMLMAQRPIGAGVLTLRSMLTLEPAIGPAGYPLLLQTGETADGVTPLIDRQHPHDLFMELAAVYAAPIARGVSAFVYVGYPGEPALGPPTFMHRVSGMDDPAAPITHHWLDSTHVTFGVVTAGVVAGPVKLEGSVFTGREPDQNRWNFDRPRFDSWSARLSVNPTPNWAFQVSYGAIHSPEQLAPAVDQQRVTASAMYNRPFSGGNWQTTLAWGRNIDRPGHTLDGLLLESAVSFGRNTFFARAETVQKDELFAPPSPLAGRVMRVSEASLGYVYDVPVAKHLALGLGIAGTVDAIPSAAREAYGGATQTGYMPFVRLDLR